MAKEFLAKADVNNGVATTTISSLADNYQNGKGKYLLYGVFGELDDYVEAENYADITILRSTTTTVDDILGSSGEQITLKATVKSDKNELVSSGLVQFQINDTPVRADDNSGVVSLVDGIAELPYTIPDTITDETTIKAIFLESDDYAGSDATGTLTIRKPVNVTVTPKYANRNDTIQLQSNITDNNGDNIASGKVVFLIDNVALQTDAEAVDVIDGVAVCNYTIPTNAPILNHEIKAIYLQNDALELDTANGTATLIVRQPTNLYATNSSVNPLQIATLEITVKDDDGINIQQSGATVNITIDGTTYENIAVGDNGVATTTHNITAEDEGRQITYTATLNQLEDGNYQTSTTETAGIITVRKGVTVTVNPVKGTIGKEVTLSGTVKDSNNDNVDKGELSFYIEEKTSSGQE